MNIKPFPLLWPDGRPRRKKPETSRAVVTLAAARDHLLRQFDALGAKSVVITSNAILRLDGLPAAKQPKLTDVGVAVWFRFTSSQSWFCVSCDLFDTLIGNMHGIGHSMGDVRKFSSRLSISLLDIFARFFLAQLPSGQQQSPPPKPPPRRPADDWRTVLEVGRVVTWTQIQANYRKLAKKHHPDKGGKVADFQRIQEAYEKAKKSFNFK